MPSGGVPSNLFVDLAATAAGEQLTELLARPGLRIERIVSFGQSSPEGFWYDQAQGEWVILLRGHARLRFEDEVIERELKPGDFLEIAPHRRHRVAWTDPNAPSVWLAVHYDC